MLFFLIKSVLIYEKMMGFRPGAVFSVENSISYAKGLRGNQILLIVKKLGVLAPHPLIPPL
jgi:hypothetical protein